MAHTLGEPASPSTSPGAVRPSSPPAPPASGPSALPVPRPGSERGRSAGTIEHPGPAAAEPGPDDGAAAGALTGAPEGRAAAEGRGCLFALSQLPLIFFLGFIATLLLLGALHDLFVL